MVAVMLDRALYAQFGRVLAYPQSDVTGGELHELRSGLAGVHDQAAAHVTAFLDEMAERPIDDWEEAYTRAFDVSPQAVPYLSVFLFGQESFKRSELMTGLLEAYARTGFDTEGELPDHLAVVLRFALHFSDAEWDEMARWCIPGPLAEMVRGLDKSGNPYRHLLHALQLVFDAEFARERNHV